MGCEERKQGSCRPQNLGACVLPEKLREGGCGWVSVVQECATLIPTGASNWLCLGRFPAHHLPCQSRAVSGLLQGHTVSTQYYLYNHPHACVFTITHRHASALVPSHGCDIHSQSQILAHVLSHVHAQSQDIHTQPFYLPCTWLLVHPLPSDPLLHGGPTQSCTPCGTHGWYMHAQSLIHVGGHTPVRLLETGVHSP